MRYAVPIDKQLTTFRKLHNPSKRRYLPVDTPRNIPKNLNLPAVVAISWCGWKNVTGFRLSYLIKTEGLWYHSSSLNIYENNYVYAEHVL